MMFFIPLRCLSILTAMLVITACTGTDRPPFIAPAERSLAASEKDWPANHYVVLAYHNVEDDVADQQFMSVRTSALNEQFVWLRENGYQPVSVDDILRAQSGGKVLPAKAVLLTFDDGYSSFYHRVYPLLKAYRWSAVLAPVGAWLDTPKGKEVDFGGKPTQRDRFLFWRQVREMSQSGLVEIAAHTYAQHKGHVANPQENMEPCAVSRGYDLHARRYESVADYRRRINDDVALITQRISEVTGKAPRVWVWPYGAAGGEALKIVRQHGYAMALTLEKSLASTDEPYNVPRILVANNPELWQFAHMVVDVRQQESMRVAHIDLDYVYDPDPARQASNLDKLVQRVADLGINTVFLQAFADPQGDGNIHSLYFPNRWLPVRADLFNHVAWQLITRAHVEVYAWMPVLAFDVDDQKATLVEKIHLASGQRHIDAQQYKRLSPWNSENRRIIIEIYEDLASHALFDGILFHDDAVLADDEDASPDALRAYLAAGFPETIAAIHQDPQLFFRWTRFKSQALVEFTQTLALHVRDIRGPQIKTARNIFALPILEPESEAWFAQNLDDFHAAYDWTAPMAMPLMENVSLNDSNAWLEKLVRTVGQRPGALSKTVFELQAKDWRTHEDRWLSADQLLEWMKTLQINGAHSYGYYPDNFLTDQPELNAIRSEFSSRWYPLP